MQQVKDRKSKISERKETRQAELERIEQAESQKEELLFEKHGQVEGHNDIETRDTEASTIRNLKETCLPRRSMPPNTRGDMELLP